jgi:transcription factor SPN1
MNVKRNPSMFGAELPRLSAPAQQPATPVTTPLVLSSAAPLLVPQATEKVKTLRRVRRLPPARRISFGSLIAPVGEDGHEADMEECEDERSLGSAFQLR